MDLLFEKLVLPAESEELAQWLSAEAWPYHSNSNLTPDRVRGMIQAGSFDGDDHQTFWVSTPLKERLGLVRHAVELG